jgi:energy-coupling factor transporter ATP-binding protein EcfA2
MALKTLDILGLRGFGTAQHLDFAIANGKPGSGLTMIVGPNNGGKSTIIESLRALSQNSVPTFTVGRRNRKAGDQVKLVASDENGNIKELMSRESGTSEMVRTNKAHIGSLFVLPSRRFFRPLFGKSVQDRPTYTVSHDLPAVRGSGIDYFAYRLFRILENRKSFDEVLAKVLSPLPKWTIDQADSGEFFLKFEASGGSHNSDGLGEGLVSLLFIIDALYDSEPGDIIVIDEPELSLHPALQRKLASLLKAYACDRQIVVATHSSYFLDFDAIQVGAVVARVYLKNGDSTISALSKKIGDKLGQFITNKNNPHILGLDAREVFFLEDGVILVEGQDDISGYGEVQRQVGMDFAGAFFGWGVGGADNMPTIAGMLNDLGFTKVVAILDANKRDVAERLVKEFPHYGCFVIPADDVRTKAAQVAKESVQGLLDDRGVIVADHIEPMKEIIASANATLSAW